MSQHPRGTSAPEREARPTFTLPLYQQIIFAALVGICAFAFSFDLLEGRDMLAGDFTWPYHGAQMLLDGDDPFDDPRRGPGQPYPFENQLPYPMTAVIVAIPFSVLSPFWSGSLFFGIGSGLLALGIARRGEWHRLPLFFSPSFFIAAMVAQWPPLVMAAAFLPWLAPLAVGKPNLALPVLVLWPRWRWFVIAAGFSLATLALDPFWPLKWLHNTEGTGHLPPVLIVPGFVLLLAVLRWKSKEGLLLLWMALVPQFLFFYDQLILFLVPRTLRASVALLAVEWIGFKVWGEFFHGGTMESAVTTSRLFVVLFFYLPALAIVLSQPRAQQIEVPWMRELVERLKARRPRAVFARD